MKFIAAISLFLASALAAPSLSLSPRTAPETLYLANCYEHSNGAATSRAAYYPAGSDSQEGEGPADTCFFGGSSFGHDNGYVTWEGTEQDCTFIGHPTHVQTHINANAQDVAVGAGCGWASNGYRNFNCFRDNDRQLFSSPAPDGGYTCYSVYYCLDACKTCGHLI